MRPNEAGRRIVGQPRSVRAAYASTFRIRNSRRAGRGPFHIHGHTDPFSGVRNTSENRGTGRLLRFRRFRLPTAAVRSTRPTARSPLSHIPQAPNPGTDICRCRTAPAAIRAGSATTDPETNDDRLAAQVCASDCLAVLVPDGKGGQLVALDAIPVRNRHSHRLSADPDRIPLHTALGEERRRQCRGQNEQQQLFHIFHTSNPPHRDARSPHFPPLPASIRATRSAIIRGVTACMQR